MLLQEYSRERQRERETIRIYQAIYQATYFFVTKIQNESLSFPDHARESAFKREPENQNHRAYVINNCIFPVDASGIRNELANLAEIFLAWGGKGEGGEGGQRDPNTPLFPVDFTSACVDTRSVSKVVAFSACINRHCKKLMRESLARV